MARKKKSSNKVVPVVVIAAALAGGYYWLTSDSDENNDLQLPGEAQTEVVANPEEAPAVEPTVEEPAPDTDLQPVPSVDENAPVATTTEQEAKAKNAYVDEHGNIIYKYPNGKSPLKYINHRQGRWGYSVKAPAFLNKTSRAQNSDGETFEDGKGKQLSTYASWNALGESITELYHKDFPGVKSVTYKKLFKKEKCYVKSGYMKDNRIFYLKEAIFEKDGQEVVATLIFLYPKSFNDQADGVVKEVFGSFPVR